MSLFDNELKISTRDMLLSMGDDVFLNGMTLRGIVNDEQYMDDMIRRQVSVSFHVDDAKYLVVGDSIIFDEETYLIRQLPDPNKEDPFYTVEVKRA